VTGEATPGTSGWFEVQIIGGPLVHSKKGGMGHVEDPESILKKVATFYGV